MAEIASDSILAAELAENKPMAKPEGTGKKKRKKKAATKNTINEDIWAGYTKPE